MARSIFHKKKKKDSESKAEMEETSVSATDSSAEVSDSDKNADAKKPASPLSDAVNSGIDQLSKGVKTAVDRFNGTGTAKYNVWSRSSKTVLMYVILIVIIIGYVFFFTSPLWVSEKMAAEDPTEIGTAQTFGEDGEKSFTIDTWRYSPSQNLMEIKFKVANNAFDGKDLYNFTVGYQGAKNYSTPGIEQMVQDPDYVVLIVRNIPTEWTSICVSLYYAGQNVENAEPLLNFYASSDSISRVSHIQILSSNGYRAALVDERISALNKKKASLQKSIDANNKKSAAMDKSMEEITERMTLDTDEEKENDESAISDIKSQQGELKAANDQAKGQIAALNKEIGQLEKKRASYFAKPKKETDKTTSKTKGKKSSDKKKTAEKVSESAVKVKETTKDSSASAKKKNAKKSPPATKKPAAKKPSAKKAS